MLDQTTIIAAVAILLLIAIYLVIKSKQKKGDPQKDKELEILETQESTQYDEYDTEPQKEEEKEEEKQEEEEVLQGSEEGSFENPPKSAAITKREVPAHGKISKENFKEFSGTKILVAEDNLINQKVIQGLLVDSGIQVDIADDGQVALDMLEKDSDYMMILMDAHMPRVDGFEATRIIRSNPKYNHIVVVALSGDTAADDIHKMTEAGMSEHLEKPLRMSALYDVLYAYSQNNIVVESDKHVIMTKELNGDKGLEVCGGDESFYHEILDEFIKSYGESQHLLETLLAENKLQEADKLLLDVIGLTANIGADPLHEIAQNIKSAIGDTTEKSYLTLIDQYKVHLEALVVDIKNYK